MKTAENSPEINEKVRAGIELFNNREFFEAHEVLEIEWRRENLPIRDLYQGLIQFSVACLHIQRNNRSGAKRLINRAIEKISPFLNNDTGFDLEQLLPEIQALKLLLGHVPPKTNLTDLEIVLPKVKYSR